MLYLPWLSVGSSVECMGFVSSCFVNRCSYVAQASLKLTTDLQVTLNFRYSLLYLLCLGITKASAILSLCGCRKLCTNHISSPSQWHSLIPTFHFISLIKTTSYDCSMLIEPPIPHFGKCFISIPDSLQCHSQPLSGHKATVCYSAELCSWASV